MSETIEIVLNGEAVAVAAGATVAEMLAALDLPRERVAVEVNRRIVRKAEWVAAHLKSGDRVEIVHFVGGG